MIDPEDALAEVHDGNDPDVNNNKGYAVLSMNTVVFVDSGLAVEKAYHAVTLSLGDPAPISTLYVPLGTFTENMRIDMQTAVGFAGWRSLGSPFEIVPYQMDWDNPEPDFTFTPDKGDSPAVIRLDYAGADLAGFDEHQLRLYRYTGSGWVDATCPEYATERFPEDDLIAVPVCRTGVFALSSADPTLTMLTVGGTVSGLTGSGLVLQKNGGDDLAIGPSANGPFTFATKLTNGSSYAVTVKTQPSNPTQTCSVANGMGTLVGSDVTNVEVSCEAGRYKVFLPMLQH